MLDKHASLLQTGCSNLQAFFGAEWLLHQSPVPLARAVKRSVPARETTLVDAKLPMVEAMRKMMQLDFPLVPGVVDSVLQKVIERVVDMSSGLERHRTSSRVVLQDVSNLLAPLTLDLQRLPTVFARPINGHVNFGLLEAMVRVCAWPHANLVDLLVYGFQVLLTFTSPLSLLCGWDLGFLGRVATLFCHKVYDHGGTAV